MQKPKTSKAVRHAKAARSNPKHKSNGARKNGSPKAGIDDGSISGPGLHILTQGLRTIPRFEAELRFGGNDDAESRDFIAMINTEEKRLQAIEDLYSIVKAQPKYKKMKEPVWNPNTPSVQVLSWLLRKLGPLAEGNNWTVDTYQDGKKERYRFVIYRGYHRQKVKDREEFIPLDFLPYLKRRDEPLHDMFVDLVALISRYNKVPLWDKDTDFSQALEQILAQPASKPDTRPLPPLEERGIDSVTWERHTDEQVRAMRDIIGWVAEKGKLKFVQTNTALENQKLSYQYGPAAAYLKLINKRMKVITPQMLQVKLAAYKANSQRKESLVYWIKSGIRLAWKKQSISVNTFVPNYIKGNPLCPFRMYKFIWSMHDNDAVKIKAYKRMEKDDKAYETYLPVEFSITYPGQKMKPIERDTFPEELYEFMRYGVAILMWRYKDYFYKNQFNERLTPAERLLEQIENIELKKIIQ